MTDCFYKTNYIYLLYPDQKEACRAFDSKDLLISFLKQKIEEEAVRTLNTIASVREQEYIEKERSMPLTISLSISIVPYDARVTDSEKTED